jgi:hypothetical protein
MIKKILHCAQNLFYKCFASLFIPVSQYKWLKSGNEMWINILGSNYAYTCDFTFDSLPVAAVE